MKQHTFMMLKPDAFANQHVDDILLDLQNAGLQIVRSHKLKVTMEVMDTLLKHYHEVMESMDPSFHFSEKLFNSFYHGEDHYIMPTEIVYEGDEDIIAYTRKLVGKTNPQEANKTSIRGHYSNDSYDKAGATMRLVNNVIHASDSFESVERELKIWEKYL